MNLNMDASAAHTQTRAYLMTRLIDRRPRESSWRLIAPRESEELHKMLSGHRFRLTSISTPKPESESKSRKHSEGSESFSLRLFSLLTGACNSTPLRLKPEKKATLKTRAKKKFFETRQGRLTTLFSAYASSICVSSVSSQSCSIVELHSAAK
jgi:hypothetical protein